MHLSTLDIVVYLGLVGVVIALFVATAQNKWQPRVFALLALRLAIGWHFCFEGLHKVRSHVIGETETNKPFTSASYFNIGDGPGAELARKKFLGDPEKTYTDRTKRDREVTPDQFGKLPVKERAALCPQAAAALLTGADADSSELAKAKYAAWVYGAEARDAKLKGVSGDTPATAPAWLEYIAVLQNEYDSRAERMRWGFGGSAEVKRTAAIKTDLNTAKADFAKATDDYIAELRTGLGLENTPPDKAIKTLDQIAMWGITAIGVGLLLGLFTRLWCVAGIGFLVMTYLTAPPWPWLPPPPPSEGNPLFINKNLIEAVALLVVLVHPTGRWLGLDALVGYGWSKLLGKKSPPPAARTNVVGPVARS